MVDSKAAPSHEKQLTDLPEPIFSYFQTFNQGDFQATAALFATDGQLLPPFEAAIVGRAAIAAYLETEAKGMQALPREAAQQTLPSGETSHCVSGQVQTPLFVVHVRWEFVLNPQSEIAMVKIKLLAALRELLHLKR
jgi:Nuclear transport factor 2 (NTF2) domain